MSTSKTNAAHSWALNYRLMGAVIAAASPAVEALNLEIKEFFVLAEIDECPYPAELAARLCMPKPTITVYLKSLEAKGFVKREIDAQDLRRHRLNVTANGRKVVTRGRAVLADAFGERLTRLSAGEREALQSLLEKLVCSEE